METQEARYARHVSTAFERNSDGDVDDEDNGDDDGDGVIID